MVRLVQGAGNTEDEAPGDDYVGCVLESHDGQRLYSFRFDSPMVASLPVEANCKHLICFPAEDGKMAACVYGMSTCGVKFPCLRCLWELETWSYPKYMKEDCPELFNDITLHRFKDFLLREGRYSREECFKTFAQMVGPNREYSEAESGVSDFVRDKCKSVFKEPLLSIDGDLHNGDPMHITQGFMTHLSEAVKKQLQEIPGGGWAQNKHAEALEMATAEVDLTKSTQYKAIKKSHTQLHNKVRKAVGKLENAHENGSSPAVIAILQDELEELAA
jgi:hypothetical protein